MADNMLKPTETQPKSSTWDQDRKHVLHPFQHFASFDEDGSLMMTGGQGCYLTDENGKRYFDAIGGMWCTNIGLGREEMADAIADQIKSMAYVNPFVDMGSEPAARLAAKLAELAPGDINHALFSCGGSTANDLAYRVVRMYHSARGKPEKRHILSRVDSYHGSTFLAASIGGKPGDRVSEFDYITDWIHHLSSPDIYRAPEHIGDEDAFCDYLVEEMERRILEIGAESTS